MCDHESAQEYVTVEPNRLLDSSQAEAPPLPDSVRDDRLLGERLVERGVLTSAQLWDAVEQQQALAQLGEQRWLGEVLVALRYVSPQALAEHAPDECRLRGASRPADAPDAGLAERLGGWLRRAVGVHA
jgi:hypothetical protein